MARNIEKLVAASRKTFGRDSTSRKGKFYIEDFENIVAFVTAKKGKADFVECVLTALEVGAMVGYNAGKSEK